MISTRGFLIMAVDNPQVVLNAITTARLKEIQGRQLLVVPHRADETQVLRNLGLKPPPVNLNHFKYTGRYTPFAHQRDCTSFLITTKRGFNLSDAGTGKTYAALWAAEYLRQLGLIKRILIICPLSVISVWEEAAFEILPHRSFAKLLGSKQRRLDILNDGSDICVINHDGISVFGEKKKHGSSYSYHMGPALKGKFDLVIGDEATFWKNTGNISYKIFKDFIKTVPYVWLLTGTPVTKAPTDAYGLIKLVNRDSFTGGFGLFREMTMRKVNEYKYVPKVDSKDTVYKYLQPAIRFKKEDCLDLPSVTYVNRQCELTAQQRKAFDLMRKRMIMEQESGDKITAANAAVKLLKLVQICCGVVKDNNGVPYYLDASIRLDALKGIVEEVGGKVIIFIPFVGVMDMVEKFLTKCGWSTGLVNGDVSETKRSKIFNDFRNGDLDCLIAHPRTAAHGLNLTVSNTICWYGPIFSTEQYQQSNARIDRAGQKRKMTIYHMVSCSLEAGIYRGLWSNIQMGAAILQQYEELTKQNA
jgi:SNF2 family DNA or RNA helicase